MKLRLFAVSALAVFAVGGPFASVSSASTCSPAFEDICYQSCHLNDVTYKVCSWFR
jgi:hypothetical protein